MSSGRRERAIRWHLDEAAKLLDDRGLPPLNEGERRTWALHTDLAAALEEIGLLEDRVNALELPGTRAGGGRG